MLYDRALHAPLTGTPWRVDDSAELRPAHESDGYVAAGPLKDVCVGAPGEELQSLAPARGLVGNVAALGEVGNADDIQRERATRENGRADCVDGLEPA